MNGITLSSRAITRARSLTIATVIICCVVATPRAQAQGPTVYKACYAGDNTGTIYRMDDPAGGFPAPGAFPKSNKPNGCAVKKDSVFFWNLAGPQGPIGLQGPIGPMGSQGAPGAPGAQGAPGAIGPAGPQGAAGADGAVGPQGATGPTGAPGADGAVGPQGATGPAGADGATGPQGATGPAGATGASGATGPQGAAGPQGTAGANGLSGFEMVLNTAFILASPTPAGVTSQGGVSCPAGKKALGGGFRANMSAAFIKDVQVVASRPQDNGAGWFVLINMYGNQQGFMEIWATCVTAP